VDNSIGQNSVAGSFLRRTSKQYENQSQTSFSFLTSFKFFNLLSLEFVLRLGRVHFCLRYARTYALISCV